MSLESMVEKLRQWRRPWTAGSEPVEIHRALLEDIEAQVVAVGGGRRIFPFDRVEVKLLAASPEERSRLEAIVQAGWDLAREVEQRLRAGGVEVAAGLAIGVKVTAERSAEFGDRRYALSFSRAARAESVQPASGRPPGAAAAAGRPLLRLAVVKGKATRDAYDFAADRVYLGRLEEVLDASGRVKRRNDVAFLEAGDLNQTVSREHARIAWDPADRGFWLRDEGSASGTLIFRGGRSIEVSRHDRRGVRLETGDEVYLGRAVVKVELGG